MLLEDVCFYVKEKRDCEGITSENFVSTDNMLPNKAGITVSEYVPEDTTVDAFKKGDVLLSNIRPYFKKIWLADKDGGCCADVLILRPKGISSELLYAYLSQDAFFEYDTKGAKGSKMPRGDKDHIMKFPLKELKNGNKIGQIIKNIDDKIALNNKTNSELENMAKTVYDYWFTQFDFPDANGNPYKTSGGKMEYNQVLKREIPAGWEVGNLYDIAEYVNGLACQNYRPQENEDSLPVIKIREMHDGFSADTERVSANIADKYIINNGDILFSWSATLETMIWVNGKGGLNQHIFKVNPKSFFSKEFVFQQLKQYIINFQMIALSRKTTMGHITSDHIEQSTICLPTKEIISKYSEQIKPIFDKSLSLQKENMELTKLRDYLLPLLMNGQIEVK